MRAPARLGLGILLVAGMVAFVPSAHAQGLLLSTLDTPNPQPGSVFGDSVAVGDVNGDGRDDIAVGTPYEHVGGNSDQGRAYVFSGADGSVLVTLDTPDSQADAAFSLSLAVGDANGDGRDDIAVAAPLEDVGGNSNQGRTYVFSAAAAPVGGIAELPDVAGVRIEDSGSAAPNAGVLVALSAGGVLLLTASASYITSRLLRRRA